jgi:hypothetical protein
MPQAQTKARRTTAGTKPAAPRRRTAAKGGDGRFTTAVDRTTELSEQVLKSVETGQREAIEAVHKFVDTVDRTLPRTGPEGEASRRQEVLDSALEMADRLVKNQYEFLRSVVHSAGKSVRRFDGAKK